MARTQNTRPRTEAPVAADGAGGSTTSYDVALRAGVSQSAVSRCFKPGASVSAKRDRRIELHIEKINIRRDGIMTLIGPFAVRPKTLELEF